MQLVRAKLLKIIGINCLLHHTIKLCGTQLLFTDTMNTNASIVLMMAPLPREEGGSHT